MRISATTLESFRLWRQPDQDWMPESELIATIKGEFTPTPKVLLGLAFGKVLADPARYSGPHGYRCDDFFFPADMMDRALGVVDRRGVFEAKGWKAYGDCTVVAKADHLLGVQLTEFKTTLGSFDVEKYMDSCQWRFMGEIFQPKVITYHVFLLNDDATERGIELRGIESFNVFPYVGLHEDCRRLVQDFTRYVEARGLADLLRERQRVADAA